MAYSDYGGYAFRNGRRVRERSDCTIRPDGDLFATPGMWPGFASLGMPEEERDKFLSYPNGHVVLGDGPLYVALCKQAYLYFYRLGEKLDDIPLMVGDYPEEAIEKSDYALGSKWINTYYFAENQRPCHFRMDEWKIDVYWREYDNFYQFVKVTQPDGNLWHGWSGYGVGEGLEDCGYGFSTEQCNEWLKNLWPEAIREDL